MRVIIEAMPVMPGIPFLFGAGRPFYVGQPTEVEILDEEPPELDVPTKNHVTGQPEMVKRPDPVRMGRAAYDELKLDKRFRFDATLETDRSITRAELEGTRAVAARLGDQLARVEGAHAALSVAHEALGDENAALKADLAGLVDEHNKAVTAATAPLLDENAALKAQLAELTAQLDKATAPTPPKPAPAPDAAKVDGQAATPAAGAKDDAKGKAPRK